MPNQITLPRVLHGFDLAFNGNNYAGTCESFTLPANNPLFEALNAGGLLRPIQVKVGYEEDWEVSWDNKGLDMGLLTATECAVDGQEVIIWGALKDSDDCAVIPARFVFTGQLKEHTPGESKKNELGDGTSRFQVVKAEYYINDQEVLMFDALNYVHRVNGEDQVSGMLKALGRA